MAMHIEMDVFHPANFIPVKSIAAWNLTKMDSFDLIPLKPYDLQTQILGEMTGRCEKAAGGGGGGGKRFYPNISRYTTEAQSA
ncbi:hypothetical protein SAY86_019578 [Trapa natans]|uniref:Uncharacterized protein n=1 Tax=Trapa natans TaxID=22666 RepID=A0AAN7LNE2_TRANT|nr:hypothetical protein SAY86_019578 [Trapa natans]